MLKQTDKDKLKALGLDIDAIIAAHTDAAEKDIVVPDGQLLTDAQLTERDTNTKTAAVKEGEKNALPLAIAEINKATGLTLDPTKIDRFGELGKQVKEKMSATDDVKLTNANKQVSDLLAAQELLTKERDTLKQTAEKTVFEYDQYKHFPANRSKLMNEQETMTLLNARKVEAKTDGVYKDGVLQIDPITKAALPHAKAYEQIFTEFKLIAEPPAGGQGGRGGGNSGGAAAGGKARTQSEAITKWKEANPNGNEMSPECSTFVQTEAKDNVTFNWNG